jgi:hypothetical protein
MAEANVFAKDLYNSWVASTGATVDKSLIDDALTHESLTLVGRDDNVFTWLGPTIVLGLFFLFLSVLTILIVVQVDNNITPGWDIFWGLMVSVLSLVIFYLYYAVISGTGKFLLTHIRRK